MKLLRHFFKRLTSNNNQHNNHHDGCVTIIIAAYMRPETLNRTLLTVYKQTYTNWRVLIISDCCDDIFLSKVDLSHKRVKLINLPLRCGNQYGPNSVGIHLANTEYLAFLNHDDLWLPDHLEIAIKSIRSHTANMFLGKAAFCHYKDQLKLSKTKDRLVFSEVNHPEMVWRALTGPNWIFEPASTWVIRTSFAKQVGYWNPPDKTKATPVMDWLTRSCQKGAKFCYSDSVSALKINLHMQHNPQLLEYQNEHCFEKEINHFIHMPTSEMRTSIATDLKEVEQESLTNRYLEFQHEDEEIIKREFKKFLNTGLFNYQSSIRKVNHKKKAFEALKNRTGENIKSFIQVEELLQRIGAIKTYSETISTHVKPTLLSHCKDWYLDEYEIKHKTHRYFSITCIQSGDSESIMLNQPEVGILGFLISDTPNRKWLVQNKAEPGNVNYHQLAPTVQATRSNYECTHGGKETLFLDYFLNNKQLLVDIEGSEQGSKFLNKFNRNCKLILKDEISLEKNQTFTWLDNEALKLKLREDYSINTDARSVLSSGYWDLLSSDKSQCFKSTSLLDTEQSSAFHNSYSESDPSRLLQSKELLKSIYRENKKVFKPIKFEDMKHFQIMDKGIIDHNSNLIVSYFDISFSEREVTNWQQPLLHQPKANHCALIFSIQRNTAYFYVRAYPEIGFYERTEFGPSFQTGEGLLKSTIEEFYNYLNTSDILTEIKQSDEGGRFFQSITHYTLALWTKDMKELNHNNGIWLSAGDLEQLSLQKGILSNELRTLISILLSFI